MSDFDQEENYQEILDEIAGVFADEFDAPVSDVLTAFVDDNGVVYGNLISAGNFYEYAADGEQLALDYLPNETREINDFAAGVVASSYGVKTDSLDSPYDYAYGFLRLDAQVRCKKGGVPCGKICLPKGSVCRKYGGGGSSAAMRNVRGKLRSPVVGGGIVAGKLAAGALAAGAAGYAASRGGANGGQPGQRQPLQQQRGGSIGRTARKVGKVALGATAGAAGYAATRNLRMYSGSGSESQKAGSPQVEAPQKKKGMSFAKKALIGAAAGGAATAFVTRNMGRKKAIGAAKERVSLAGGPDAIDVDYTEVKEPKALPPARKRLPAGR